MSAIEPRRGPRPAREDMKVTTLRLPADLSAELAIVARVDDVPVSELVRAALYELVANRRSDPHFKRRFAKQLKNDLDILKRLEE